MESPTVAEFSPDGQRLVTGGFRSDRALRVFDTAVPGRDCATLRMGKTRRSSDGQKGLVSAVGIQQHTNLLAVGTYTPGSIYLYDLRSSGTKPSGTILAGQCVVGHGQNSSRRAKKTKKRSYQRVSPDGMGTADDGADDDDANAGNDERNEGGWFSAAKHKWFHARTRGGVTQLRFAPDGADVPALYSTSRRSNAVLCWDLRMLSDTNAVCGLRSFDTDNDTNQRLEFDLHDDTLYVGGNDRCVRAYDTKTGNLIDTIAGLDDTANGTSFGSCSQNGDVAFLAVATGSRHFPSEDDLDRNDAIYPLQQPPNASLRLYALNLRVPNCTAIELEPTAPRDEDQMEQSQ